MIRPHHKNNIAVIARWILPDTLKALSGKQ
jgi:hypothetical protein